MVDLDDLDLEILELLLEDGRRSFNDIAERVGVSGPTVSDRIDRLIDRGVIRRFTVDVDREVLLDGVTVLVDLTVRPGHGEAVMAGLLDVGGIEHMFRTADDRVLAVGRLEPTSVREELRDHLEYDAVIDVDIALVESVEWSPSLEASGFAFACAECGNTVTDEGTAATLDGDTYHFCCTSCADRFTTRYEELNRAA